MEREYENQHNADRNTTAAAQFQEEMETQGQGLYPPDSMPFENDQQKEEEEERTGVGASMVPEEKQEEEVQMKVDPPTFGGSHAGGCGCASCGGAVQRKEQGEPAHAAQNSVASASHGTKTTLPEEVQAQMESALGADFSAVNIYTNSEKATQLGAKAYTQGTNIYFGKGHYEPNSNKGQELLGHELTHVIQQQEGRVKPTVNVKGMPVNDSDSLEQEADVMGAKASRTQISKKEEGPIQRKKSTTNNQQVVQGFFGKVWKGIKKVGSAIGGGAKKAWGGIKKAGKWVGGAAKKAWGGIKKAGKWIGGAAKKVWNGVKWVGKQAWSKVKGVFLRAWRFITKLPSRLKRLALHVWKGVKNLKPWSLKWWKSLGKASTWKNFGKWVGEFAIYAAETLGIGEIYETIVDFLKFNTRELTSREKAVARKVFGGSINYGLVRVDSKALLGPSWTKRAYVSFHTINAWGPLTDRTLIHELTHVWQYENKGAMYMPRAIHAQGTPAGYSYAYADVVANNGNLEAFNYEQQGEVLGDYYNMLTNDPTNSKLAVYELYADYARSR